MEWACVCVCVCVCVFSYDDALFGVLLNRLSPLQILSKNLGYMFTCTHQSEQYVF